MFFIFFIFLFFFQMRQKYIFVFKIVVKKLSIDVKKFDLSKISKNVMDLKFLDDVNNTYICHMRKMWSPNFFHNFFAKKFSDYLQQLFLGTNFSIILILHVLNAMSSTIDQVWHPPGRSVSTLQPGQSGHSLISL